MGSAMGGQSAPQPPLARRAAGAVPSQRKERAYEVRTAPLASPLLNQPLEVSSPVRFLKTRPVFCDMCVLKSRKEAKVSRRAPGSDSH
jgi:hypothetical protein